MTLTTRQTPSLLRDYATLCDRAGRHDEAEYVRAVVRMTPKQLREWAEIEARGDSEGTPAPLES